MLFLIFESYHRKYILVQIIFRVLPMSVFKKTLGLFP